MNSNGGDVKLYKIVGPNGEYVTDAKGELSFTLPEAGMYLLSAGWPGQAAAPALPGQPPVMPARRLSYAATVEILPQ